MGERLTILVAARDEEARIGTTVVELRRQFPNAEVIVADDGSRDGTAELASAAGAWVLRLPHRGKGQALTLAERAAPPGTILLCDADLRGDLTPLLGGDADLTVAAFARRQGGGFGIAKEAARRLIELASGFRAREPLSGQRRLTQKARDAVFPLAAGFGCESAMTADAAKSSLAIGEAELELEHRATGRDLAGFVHRGRQLRDIALAFGPQGRNHRGLRLPLVGWVVAIAQPAVLPVAALGVADDLWSGEERGFSKHLRSGSTTGVLKLVGIPVYALAAHPLGLRRGPRRARGEHAEPARHEARARVEGLPRGVDSARRAERDRRPAASLRSSRDGDARRLRFERARRRARFTVREQVHGEAALERDCGARGSHPPRRASLARCVDREDAGVSNARCVGEARSMSTTGEHDTKYIFVTGGVVSALGKGIVAASLGRLLKERGLRVQAQKFDPYLNVDPGTMSPFQHGEVFVTEDGAETDLDIGHYERFIDENLSRNASHSAGAIWDAVLRKERKGEFLGATVQVIPHITNEIKLRIKRAAKAAPADVVISEIGGTVGDIESLPFLEAIRQFRREVGPENVMYLHCTLVPFIEAAGELKTKPTQHSVNELRRIGIHPDVIVCRSHEELSQDIKDKIALFADVDIRSVIAAPDVSDVYLVPAVLRDEGLDDLVCAQLGIEAPRSGLGEWQEVIDRIGEPREPVTIALVGKYVKLHDAYLSVHEALKHAGVHQGAAVRVQWVDAENMSYEETAELLEQVDGVLVPGGFGSRGWEGKILACQVARERGIPYLGICLGMHVAVSEYARNVAGFDGANSTEMDPETPYPVIDLLPEQKEIEDLGGTMRLGAQAVELADGTRTRDGLRRCRHPRAPPSPLRGQQPVPPAADRRRPGRLGHLSGGAPGRDRRAAGSPVVRGQPVPPRVQVAADTAGTALP